MKVYKGSHWNRGKSVLNFKWSAKIFILSMVLSTAFGVLSEIVLNSTIVSISIIIILFFLFVNVVCDLIGVAVTAGNLAEMEKLCDKSVCGAREGCELIKNAEKVALFCCDIIGDISGILSGACGVAIVMKIAKDFSNDEFVLILTAVVSGLIASVTIFCKSIEKGFAVCYANKIILKLGRVINFFNKNK